MIWVFPSFYLKIVNKVEYVKKNKSNNNKNKTCSRNALNDVWLSLQMEDRRGAKADVSWFQISLLLVLKGKHLQTSVLNKLKAQEVSFVLHSSWRSSWRSCRGASLRLMFVCLSLLLSYKSGMLWITSVSWVWPTMRGIVKRLNQLWRL